MTTNESKHDAVSNVLDHAFLGVEMLSRDNADWDGVNTYGYRLYATAQHLRKAQEEFAVAKKMLGDA